MGLTMSINVKAMQKTGAGPSDVRAYLAQLKSAKVMFLNGPESPGPCMMCLQFHRTIWKRSDISRPRPLLHPHCYCRTVSFHPQGVRAPKVMKKGEYLAKQVTRLSLKNRALLMGKGMARLHKLGIVRTEGLVNADGVVTLEAALGRYGITKAQFNKLSDRELLNIVAAKT